MGILLALFALRAHGADRASPTPAVERKPVALQQPADLLPESNPAVSSDPTLRFRIAWGGGAERIWQGRVGLSAGTISDPHSLGVEADEPGSMWVAGDHLELRAQTPRAYDGVDFAVNAPLSAKLLVEFVPRGDDKHAQTIEVPLADLMRDVHNGQLDDQGNRVLIRRAPGDAIQLKLDRDSLVFSPGEEWPLEIQPQLPLLAPGTLLHLKATLASARGGKALWSKEQEVKVNAPETSSSVSFAITMPADEGVYELQLEASERGLLRWNKPVADRKLQFIVLGTQPIALPTNRATWTTVEELDPANPKGWDLLTAWPGLNNFRKGPLSNGHSAIWNHSLGPLIQLAPSPRNGELSWEAYPLAISKPGMPHILEVDVPSDIAQTLGISILEPNAAGALLPIGLDSGIDVAEEMAPATSHWLHHRIVFWPRTKSPLVMFSNHRETTRAVFGKLRVLAGPAHLSRLLPDTGETSGRMLAGYLQKPLFPQNFSASEALDSWSGRSLTDWQTFYEGGTRLIEYLHHTGQNGLMLGILADASTIYPSRLVEPTPRYDTGAFF
ncbi:MAG TPA: hypothetical protein VFE24_09300, partial [Pirellulales bacterium]|nr:hypothetical protein [Pirellulales bacterium]